MNRFLYAEANPATFIDPDGHSSGPLCMYGAEDCYAVQQSGQTVRRNEGYSSTGIAKQERVEAQKTNQLCQTYGECGTEPGGAPYVPFGDYGVPPEFPMAAPEPYMKLSDCRDCSVDATGFVYDPYGLDPWGNPFPFVCVGARDVRECLHFVSYAGSPRDWDSQGFLGSTVGTVGGCGGFGGGFSGVYGSTQYCFVVDADWGLAITQSTFVGKGTGSDVTLAIGTLWSDGKKVGAQEGLSVAGGISAGTPRLSIGLDASVSTTNGTTTTIGSLQFGGQQSVVGPTEFHFGASFTDLIFSSTTWR